MRLCPHCRTSNKEASRFCASCGFALIAPDVLLPSAVLQGRYEIVGRIGGGGMSTVFKAFDTRLGNAPRVVKGIKPTQSLDPDERAMAAEGFRREAEILAKLDHPNLPKVFDYFREGGRHYLVMDFIDGWDLRWIVENQPELLTEEWVVEKVAQLCDALSYLHDQTPPVIFRDLKPSNIMVTQAGRAKVIDFGIARFFEPHKQKDTRVMGTPGYAAPEQYGKAQTDARSDIYSLGVVLHELLTGHDPSETPFNLPPVCDLKPELPEHWGTITQKATALDRNARFTSAQDLRRALSEGGTAGRKRKVRTRSARSARRSTRGSRPRIEPELVVVPAGPFLMGSTVKDRQADDDEKPQHDVTLPAFEIGRYPVTNAEYAAFVEAAGHSPPHHWPYGVLPEELADHPVMHVSWYDAQNYTAWLREQTGREYRLPTEAEWEKAARGEDGRLWPWGNHWNREWCNSVKDGPGTTTPVGQYSPAGDSPYACADMAGNVFEWCQSLRKPYPYQADDGREDLETRGRRVMRGGAYNSSVGRVRCACRFRYDQPSRLRPLGFRCVVAPV